MEVNNDSYCACPFGFECEGCSRACELFTLSVGYRQRNYIFLNYIRFGLSFGWHKPRQLASSVMIASPRFNLAHPISRFFSSTYRCLLGFYKRYCMLATCRKTSNEFIAQKGVIVDRRSTHMCNMTDDSKTSALESRNYSVSDVSMSLIFTVSNGHGSCMLLLFCYACLIVLSCSWIQIFGQGDIVERSGLI